ncbi:hypothetical protein N7539_004361 [Penicillium diatomitis]|uniref:Uncharacterized protein n=1 Tax=Penicillium diatomitis TaxID=2819901 RepID=A0A9W9XDR9_9EURO|nr:uncharacterized protein N7539_004361 [Penicillium diatomitis]KAJ5489471.1 hypothetical protein N7539_004361 [Penicillium diatomitis]
MIPSLTQVTVTSESDVPVAKLGQAGYYHSVLMMRYRKLAVSTVPYRHLEGSGGGTEYSGFATVRKGFTRSRASGISLELYCRRRGAGESFGGAADSAYRTIDYRLSRSHHPSVVLIEGRE